MENSCVSDVAAQAFDEALEPIITTYLAERASIVGAAGHCGKRGSNAYRRRIDADRRAQYTPASEISSAGSSSPILYALQSGDIEVPR